MSSINDDVVIEAHGTVTNPPACDTCGQALPAPTPTHKLATETFLGADGLPCDSDDAIVRLGGKGDEITLRQAVKLGLAKETD